MDIVLPPVLRAVSAALLVGSAALPAAAAAAPATAQCAVTVTVSGDNTGLTLSPARSRIDAGGCVAFDNSTNTPITIAVGGPGKTWQSGSIAAGDSAGYPAAVVGTHDVNAKQSCAVLCFGTGQGTVRVVAPPSPSPSPTPSRSASPAPASGGSGRTGSRHRTTSAHRSGGSKRTRTSTAAKRRHSGGSQVQLPPLHIPAGATGAPFTVMRRGDGSSPRVAGPQAAGEPLDALVTPSPSPSPSVLAAAPRITPPGGSSGSTGRDLALAIGGLLVIGQLAALLRVLLAVDDAPQAVPAPS